MNRILLICLSAFLLTACGNSGKNATQDSAAITGSEAKPVDGSTVYVYYFHGKQRCMTCNAVEKVAKQTVDDHYASNPKVVFSVLATDDKANKALTEKYEISWNGLVIAKEENSVNITRQAFADAVKNPDALAGLIKSEVNKRLE